MIGPRKLATFSAVLAQRAIRAIQPANGIIWYGNQYLEWAAKLNQSGEAYVTPAMLDGRWIVRVSIGTELTERKHVAQLWQLMQQAAN